MDPKHVKAPRKSPPLRVVNVKGTQLLDQSVNFNPFPQSRYSKNLNFYVFHFHDFFDGLIGWQSLLLIKGAILPNHTLRLPDLIIPLKRKFPGTINVDLKAHESKIVKIPIDKKQGDILLEEDLKISDKAFINAGLYSVNNFETYAVMTNNSSKPTSVRASSLCVELNNFETALPDQSPPEHNNPELLSLIRQQHLNSEEKSMLRKLILKYAHCFHTNESQLSFTNTVKHKINTTDDLPVYSKNYRYPFCHRQEVQKQIRKMLNDGIIRPSDSPWSSPIWIVPKKLDASGEKKWRLVIDYRKLNEKTIDDRYPVPNITDVLDKLGKCQYFTTLDLASGFHQVEIEPKDIPKTTFCVENGHYEFIRMPFGLKNAPSTFQRVMDNVLREHIGKLCFVYMDDIIVYSTSLEEHICSLKKIFETLDKYNLKLQLDKCEFLSKEVAYLGHIVTPEGIKPNPDKIKAIIDWPLPRNDKELRGFLGTLSYYRRFIKDLARIIKPLTSPLCKGQKLEHTPEFIETFAKCKALLTSSHVLQYPDFSQPFILTTDASNSAIGAVLSQGPIGRDRPVAFASRTLCRTEENYSAIEKELLAIIWACKYFRPYLYGRKFTLYTDHQPLTYAFGTKTTNNRLIRWRLDLAEYQYDIRYKPGRQNVVADGLSRITPNGNINTSEASSSGATCDTSVVNEPDEETTPTSETSSSDGETNHSAESCNQDLIPMTELAVNHFSNQIILKIGPSEPDRHEKVYLKVHRHIIVKPSFNNSLLIKIFKEKMDYKKVNCIYCPESLIQQIQNVYKEYFASSKLLKIKISQTLRQDVSDFIEQSDLIRKVHDRAHRGIEENFKVISKTYYFPNLKAKIRNFIGLCETCKKAKYDRKPYEIQLASTPTPKKPLDILHVDVFISQPHLFLSAVDKLSKFAMLIPINSRTIPDIRAALLSLIRTYGNPKLIVSDNEPCLKSIEIRSLLQKLEIEQYFTPSGHSETNGTVERFHSTLSEILRCIKPKYPDLPLPEVFSIAVALYNSTIHSATNLKPIEIFYGIKEGEERSLKLDQIIANRDKVIDEIAFNLEQKQRQDREKQNKKREKEPELTPNETVFLKDHRVRNKTGNRFIPVKVSENRRKTFIDNKGRKLHKSKIKRKTGM